MPVRGPKFELKHGPTSFTRVMSDYHVLSCYCARRPKAQLVTELKNNFFFSIFLLIFLIFLLELENSLKVRIELVIFIYLYILWARLEQVSLDHKWVVLGYARFDELSVASIVLTGPILNGSCSCHPISLYLSPNMTHKESRAGSTQLLSCRIVSMSCQNDRASYRPV